MPLKRAAKADRNLSTERCELRRKGNGKTVTFVRKQQGYTVLDKMYTNLLEGARKGYGVQLENRHPS